MANPTGRSHYSRPQPGQFLYVNFNVDGMAQLAAKLRGEAQRADPAIRAANTRLAILMQEEMVQALRSSIAARGRQQRAKPENERLEAAIEDERNRRVTLHGFTVGHLEDIPSVSKYWRKVESGFPAMTMSGSWQGIEGNRVGPAGSRGQQSRSQNDPRFIQFTGPNAYVIHARAFGGYHFIEEGLRRWRVQGYAADKGVAIFQEEFSRKGMDLFSRWLSRHGSAFGAANISAPLQRL